MVLQAIRYRAGSATVPQSLEILDQLLLPHRTVFFAIRTCDDAHAAIKQMKVRGAPAIAIVAALALAVELGAAESRSGLPNAAEVEENIRKRLEYLKSSRPTAVNLSDAVGKLKLVTKNAANEEGADGKTVAVRYIEAAERMLVDDVADNEAIGRHGARWIARNTIAGQRQAVDRTQQLKILTHCNTGSLATAGYGTALGVIRSLRSSGVLAHTYCTETRPYNQGSRLTAYELVHDDIPASLITDSMAGALLARECNQIAAVVVGADRVAANGDTANKIGTYALAVLARYHGVKFLVAAPKTTIDLGTASGRDIEIEQRPAEEVTRIRGPMINDNGDIMIKGEPAVISTAASGIDVWNPAFDVTPAQLIDGVITEDGVVERNSNGQFDFESLFKDPIQNGNEP